MSQRQGAELLSSSHGVEFLELSTKLGRKATSSNGTVVYHLAAPVYLDTDVWMIRDHRLGTLCRNPGLLSEQSQR